MYGHVGEDPDSLFNFYHSYKPVEKNVDLPSADNCLTRTGNIFQISPFGSLAPIWFTCVKFKKFQKLLLWALRLRPLVHCQIWYVWFFFFSLFMLFREFGNLILITENTCAHVIIVIQKASYYFPNLLLVHVIWCFLENFVIVLLKVVVLFYTFASSFM